MDKVEEIRRLYYETSRSTIQRDLDRAIDLLKSLPSEDDRQRAAVYMDGLSQMRSEWGVSGKPPRQKTENRRQKEKNRRQKQTRR